MFKKFKSFKINRFYRIHNPHGSVGYINLNTVKTAMVTTSRFPKACIEFVKHDDEKVCSKDFESWEEAMYELDKIFNNR